MSTVCTVPKTSPRGQNLDSALSSGIYNVMLCLFWVHFFTFYGHFVHTSTFFVSSGDRGQGISVFQHSGKEGKLWDQTIRDALDGWCYVLLSSGSRDVYGGSIAVPLNYCHAAFVLQDQRPEKSLLKTCNAGRVCVHSTVITPFSQVVSGLTLCCS